MLHNQLLWPYSFIESVQNIFYLKLCIDYHDYSLANVFGFLVTWIQGYCKIFDHQDHQLPLGVYRRGYREYHQGLFW
jgi:hypothetical protein